MIIRCLGLSLMVLSLSACGGNDTKDIDCDSSVRFQNRVEGPRVVVPEGLDPLNELAEMPIPRADPNAPQMPPGVCNDMPPMIRASGS